MKIVFPWIRMVSWDFLHLGMLFCLLREAFGMRKTYFMTSKLFRHLITQSNAGVETITWLPMVCLGMTGAHSSQVFVAYW